MRKVRALVSDMFGEGVTMAVLLEATRWEATIVTLALPALIVFWIYAWDQADNAGKAPAKHKSVRRGVRFTVGWIVLVITVFIQRWAAVMLFALSASSQPEIAKAAEGETVKVTAVSAAPTHAAPAAVPAPASGSATVTMPMNNIVPIQISDPEIIVPRDSVAVRENNPLNMKLGTATRMYVDTGDATISSIIPTDGGRFLRFKSAERGLEAARDLICSPIYQGISIDEALKKWSNNGYGANILSGSDIRPEWQVEMLTASALATLLRRMAQVEGFDNADALVEKVGPRLKRCGYEKTGG